MKIPTKQKILSIDIRDIKEKSYINFSLYWNKGKKKRVPYKGSKFWLGESRGKIAETCAAFFFPPSSFIFPFPNQDIISQDEEISSYAYCSRQFHDVTAHYLISTLTMKHRTFQTQIPFEEIEGAGRTISTWRSALLRAEHYEWEHFKLYWKNAFPISFLTSSLYGFISESELSFLPWFPGFAKLLSLSLKFSNRIHYHFSHI